MDVSRIRRGLVISLAAVITSILLVTAEVRAQACHSPLVDGAADEPFRTYLGMVFGTYGSGRTAGDYQGLYAGFGYSHPWFSAELRLPAYRLKPRDGGRELGLGDMVLGVSGTALRLRDDQVTMGVALPVMLPTGDPDRSLGMGHTMIMPAAWLSLDFEPFRLRAELGYGRVLGGGGSRHEAGHGAHGAHGASGDEPDPRFPIVNPMNRAELEHALSMSLGLSRSTRVMVSWVGAVPVGEEGTLRQVLAGGAAVRLGHVESSFELQHPVAGDPFLLRLVLQVSAAF